MSKIPRRNPSNVRLENTGPGQMKVEGDLIFATATALWKISQRRMAAADGDITIDLAGVRRADSAGLALLVEWLRLAQRQNRRIHFTHLPEQLLTMAKTYDLESLLPIAHG
ncbi:MAG: STAS domain-containing protein [Methylohalobius sp. ZOD2]